MLGQTGAIMDRPTGHKGNHNRRGGGDADVHYNPVLVSEVARLIAMGPDDSVPTDEDEFFAWLNSEDE